MNIDPNAAAGEDTVSLTAEGFNGQGFLPAQQGESQQATGTFSVSRISLSIQQGPIAISTGDTSDKIGVSVNPSTFQFSPTLTGALSSNPSSSCTSTLGFPTPPTGTGTVYAPVTASGGASYCSGIFNVLAAVSGSTSPATQVVVPPQVLIQMLYAEAHGQSAPGDASQPMLLATMKNRFGQTVWPGGGTGTWQAVVIPGQVSINTSITTGSQPELSNSASVFTGATPSSIVQDAQAFWSPTTTQWTSIQSYLSAGTPSNAVSDTTWKSTLGAPQAWAGQYKQALVSRSVANNTQGGKYAGAPAFVFLQLAPSGTAPAVISIP
jgi:hypothetical protein